MKKRLLLAALGLSFLIAPSLAEEVKVPIRIGSIDLFTGGAFSVEPYRKGVEMAVEEINAKGGILGRPVEILFRDSKFDPSESVRLAEELKSRDKVDIIINCDLSQASIAVGSWAKQNKFPFVVTSSEADTVIWDNGNEYMIRTTPGGYAWVSGSLQKAMEVYGDKLKNKKWAALAPNLEFGKTLVATVKELSAARGLNPEWVGEQWPAYDKMAPGPTLAALERAKPDVVFAALFGTDIVKFVREAKKRGFLKDRIFIFPTIGLPDHVQMLGAEMPKGWVSVGYPYDEVKEKKPELAAFMKKYREKFKEDPKVYTVMGYDGVKAAAAAIEKAGSTDPAKIVAAFPGLTFDSPYGKQTIRPIDHQATVLYWVGLTDVKDDKAVIRDWTEFNVNDNSPPDDVILKLRSGKK